MLFDKIFAPTGHSFNPFRGSVFTNFSFLLQLWTCYSCPLVSPFNPDGTLTFGSDVEPLMLLILQMLFGHCFRLISISPIFTRDR